MTNFTDGKVRQVGFGACQRKKIDRRRLNGDVKDEQEIFDLQRKGHSRHSETASNPFAEKVGYEKLAQNMRIWHAIKKDASGKCGKLWETDIT